MILYDFIPSHGNHSATLSNLDPIYRFALLESYNFDNVLSLHQKNKEATLDSMASNLNKTMYPRICNAEYPFQCFRHNYKHKFKVKCVYAMPNITYY